jgi:hypothetical protein
MAAWRSGKLSSKCSAVKIKNGARMPFQPPAGADVIAESALRAFVGERLKSSEQEMVARAFHAPKAKGYK